jgi:Protein of unknown function (DUF2797)
VTDTPYLVHGVFWDGPPPGPPAADGGTPVLRLQTGSGGFREVKLDAGSRLGFRLAAAGKFCLGHHKVFSPSERDHVLCPDAAPAVKGSQCERCFVVDDSRLIHDFHRGGRVPEGLRSYLMQPHWLYVATFASGASKVGTASQLRKWNRLAEQGAVVARYIARADDGRVVRLLEDMVTREAGLPQQVRSAAKAAALTGPHPGAGLDSLNQELAAKARSLVAGAAVDGVLVADEQWQRPAQARAICRGEASRHAYPHELSAGSHGFTLESLCGSNALARLPDHAADHTPDHTASEPAPRFVVNLGLLKARMVELGDFASETPAVQESLF